jgi:hypothetical protein
LITLFERTADRKSGRADLETVFIAAARTLICEDAFRPRTGQITDR